VSHRQSTSTPRRTTARTVRAVILACLKVNVVGFAASTLRERGYVLRAFARSTAAAKRIKHAIPLDLIEWINGHVAWKSGWRRKGVAATIKAAMNWGERVGLIPVGSNPFRGVSYRACTRRRPASDDDIQLALRQSDPCFRRLLIFCSMTGARPGEVYKTEWEHLDLDAATITLHEHKTASRTGEPRVIHLHPALVKLLTWLAHRQPAGSRFVLLNSYGRRWQPTAVHYRLDRLREKFGLTCHFTLGCCRHRFATNAVLAKVDLITLGKLLNHRRVTTTEHYLHSISVDNTRCQEALAKIVGRRTTTA
jgi:integrase